MSLWEKLICYPLPSIKHELYWCPNMNCQYPLNASTLVFKDKGQVLCPGIIANQANTISCDLSEPICLGSQIFVRSQIVSTTRMDYSVLLISTWSVRYYHQPNKAHILLLVTIYRICQFISFQHLTEENTVLQMQNTINSWWLFAVSADNLKGNKSLEFMIEWCHLSLRCVTANGGWFQWRFYFCTLLQ